MKVLSKKPLCFTVSRKEMEKYGWGVHQQLSNNPKSKQLFGTLYFEAIVEKTKWRTESPRVIAFTVWNLGFKKQSEEIRKRKCPFCGKKIDYDRMEDEFKDIRSYKLFLTTGLCQECQKRNLEKVARGRNNES